MSIDQAMMLFKTKTHTILTIHNQLLKCL